MKPTPVNAGSIRRLMGRTPESEDPGEGEHNSVTGGATCLYYLLCTAVNQLEHFSTILKWLKSFNLLEINFDQIDFPTQIEFF